MNGLVTLLHSTQENNLNHIKNIECGNHSKYSNEVIQKIAKLKELGYSSREIARLELGSETKKSSINDILNRLNGSQVSEKYQKVTKEPKILFLDFETAAALVYCFGRHKQFINQDAVAKEGGWIIMGGYNRWKIDEESSVVYNKRAIPEANDYEVCKFFWNLFNESNVVIGHNVKNFDLKVLETRCLANGLPPLPFVQVIDTLEIAKKKFRFPSNRLDALAAYLNIGRKTPHSGIKLWVDTQAGNQEAIEKMKEYCKNDVDLLIDVYFTLASRGLVSGYNAAMFYDDVNPRCHVCGSNEITLTGRPIHTQASEFEETRCNHCGAVGRTRLNRLSKEKQSNLVAAPKS